MPLALKQRFAQWRVIHWVFFGLGVLSLVLAVAGVLLVWVLVHAVAPSRKLSDFNPAEARDFVSAHLPAPLPSSAQVEQLQYERFTDWHLTARVRFDSPTSALLYLERVRADRKLNDAFCNHADPSGGARYFLPQYTACGSAKLGKAPELVDVLIHTT